MIYKFYGNLYFVFPKIFEYVVIESENCNKFDYSIKVKAGQQICNG